MAASCVHGENYPFLTVDSEALHYCIYNAQLNNIIRTLTNITEARDRRSHLRYRHRMKFQTANCNEHSSCSLAKRSSSGTSVVPRMKTALDGRHYQRMQSSRVPKRESYSLNRRPYVLTNDVCHAWIQTCPSPDS